MAKVTEIRIKRKKPKTKKNRTVMVPAQRLPALVSPKYPSVPRKKTARISRMPPFKMSNSDVNFLKAAFAPVDFRQLDVDGVPDTYVGPSLVKHHTYFDYYSLEPEETKVVIVAPVPGMAFFSGNEYSDRTEYTGVTFPDTDNMFGSDFGSSDTSWNVNGARYIGLSAEFRPVSSVVGNAGAIVVAKVPLQLQRRNLPNYVPTAGATTEVSSFGANVLDIDLIMMNTARLTAGPFNMFHANEGAYAIAGNLGDWAFTPVDEDIRSYPPLTQLEIRKATTGGEITFVQAALPALNGRLRAPGTYSLPCLCKNESLVFILSNKGEAKLTYQIAVHAVVEYTVNPKSILYPYAQSSAAPNRAVLDMYAAAMARVPTAVPYYQNDSFWERVLSIWKRLLGIGVVAGAAIPGYGPAVSGIAGGLQAITSGVESLLI